ncbi:uncharacterized protein LOC110264704 [Arachis ipaensis]|uniref:GRF-type domain-containing protein n=1 Tax=Arachis hypogaea TaxID=3818 RepID=A0A445CCE7_ARAHY|nr:uncharacterized protein LOC110264704 [Arachis ipaensis]XP_025668356.1 uncharacterized protein LOC112766672 [Arachis hypogaea]QHN93357.1 uncharacterized protein DS421_17g591990 [Arachis hypogaea]RYR48523.1 hypothetical protein Ahy_A07g034545 [Arachis hypogaea]
MMSGSRSGDLPSQSIGSHESNSAMRRRRKMKDQTCFCGLKTTIKKSGTRENPDRLFHTCARYPKESHCNFFRWVEEDGYVAGAETDAEVGGDYDEWRLNVSWRLGSLEGEVRAMKMLIMLLSVAVVVATVLCVSLLVTLISK